MIKLYGILDDIIVIEGQIEARLHVADNRSVFKFYFIDGTIAEIWYQHESWSINILSEGEKFDRLDFETNGVFTDVLYMKESKECLIKRIEEF